MAEVSKFRPSAVSAGRSISGLRGQRIVKRVVGWSILAVILLSVLFPIYWMLVTAFDPPTLSYNANATLLPSKLTTKAFDQLFAQYPFATWIQNTFLVATGATVLAVALGTTSAYSLSRLRYPGRETLASLFFLVYLFPSTLLFVPIYVLLSGLKLTNSYISLTAVYLTFTIPFVTWMLRAYLASIPRELEEAAEVDGATRLQAMVLVILPLAAPGVAASAIFSFTLAWNEYLYAFILLNDKEKMTLSPGITQLIMGDIFLWGMIMAAASLMSIPVLILYFAAQRFGVTGLTAGAVKG